MLILNESTWLANLFSGLDMWKQNCSWRDQVNQMKNSEEIIALGEWAQVSKHLTSKHLFYNLITNIQLEEKLFILWCLFGFN